MCGSSEAFHLFDEPVDSIALPEKFTYPFCYQPHALAIVAAEQVQKFLNEAYDNEHNFGIDPNHPGLIIGKMFGVLIVRQQGKLGFLAAYSGKLASGKQHPYFVPSVYDIYDEQGIYLTGTKELTAINLRIEALEKNPEYLQQANNLEATIVQSITAVEEFKRFIKDSKKERDAKRKEAALHLSPASQTALAAALQKESQQQKIDLKNLQRHWQYRIDEAKSVLAANEELLTTLRESRKQQSAALQQQLFESYKFLNARNEERNLLDIFCVDNQAVPPAAAGECAAPKLLQYAYLHNLEPICMAEFWWGQSPKSEIRKHGEYYPACRTKCLPILGFMLEGLVVDDNPLENNPAEGKDLAVVFEDEVLIVYNKPAEFLSVPGRYVSDSVQTRFRESHPDGFLVHRLDQSTSGILLAAKNLETYTHLQSQFIKRTVKKRYAAVLETPINGAEGLVDLPLRVDLDNRPCQVVCYEYGKPAQTKYEVIKVEDGRTHIHFYPITGRTHQLRMHAAHSDGLNAPILGDDLYGTKHKRLFLHAEYLEFTHPLTKERLRFTVPAHFEDFL